MVEPFSNTSQDPYHRHQYKLYYYNSKPKILEFYDDVWTEWVTGLVKLIEVIDKKEKRTNTSKGFK